MSFSINATDPDSDQLTYEWYLDDEDTGERTSSYVIDRLRISPGTYNLTVLVTDSEGNYIEHTWNLNVEPEGSKKSESSESGIGIIIAVVIIIIILIILLVLLVLRKKRTYGEIEDIFVISRAGLLLAHKSKEIRPDMDDDILSGMLTAIQDFVKDAFGEKSKFGLKRLDFGDSEIRLKRGNGYFIAVVFTGTEPANLEANLDKTIVNLEDKYGNVLETWAGNRSQLRGIKDQLDDLLK